MSEAPRSNALKPAGHPEETLKERVPANLDSVLQSILGRWANSFGMAAVVLRGNSIVAQGVAGVRKKGAAERITAGDRFHLGSCAKAMSATLFAILAEEGRLSWTDTLGRIFAGAINDIEPVWDTVTLPQLFAHCAGLRFIAGRALQSRVLSSRQGFPQQRLEIARHMLTRRPDRHPRTQFSWLSYSNLGYVLAAAALEHATGCAWEGLMRERLFLPLHITTGGFGPPVGVGNTDQPWGHSWINGRPMDARSPAAEFPLFYAPAGLVHMSVLDWAKFVALHLCGHSANPHHRAALLKPDTFSQLHTKATAGTYSAGWKFTTDGRAKGGRPEDTGLCLWHPGSNFRWFSAVFVAPEIDFAILVACNRGPDIPVWKTRQVVKALIGHLQLNRE